MQHDSCAQDDTTRGPCCQRANVMHSCWLDLFLRSLPCQPNGQSSPIFQPQDCIMPLHSFVLPRCREKVACMDAWSLQHHHDMTACVPPDHVALSYDMGNGACLFVLLHDQRASRPTFLQKNCACVHTANYEQHAWARDRGLCWNMI